VDDADLVAVGGESEDVGRGLMRDASAHLDDEAAHVR
jgi:hypothetical protein